MGQGWDLALLILIQGPFLKPQKLLIKEEINMARKLVIFQTSRKQICTFFFKALLTVKTRHKRSTHSHDFIELLLCARHWDCQRIPIK